MVDTNLKTICSLPFTHLATHPNGLVSPCCIANFENGVCFSKNKNKVLTLGKDSIEDIMNSDSFTEIRRKMMNNEKPIECIGCYRIEENGFKSKRDEENAKYLNKISISEKLPNIQLKFIELRLGNVCNIKCLTCNPMSSSKWIEDVKRFPSTFGDDHYNYEDYKSGWFKNKEWYDELLNHSSELEEIYINGGEPTLIKEHFYFLEKLISLDKSKNIKLVYNINCTNLPDRFLELLRKFREVKLQLSIDDVGNRNDYIRYPSKWEVVYDNFLKLKKEKLQITITQTISVLNVCNVWNFREFFSGEQIEYNFVYSPNYLHISCLHPKLKDLAMEQIHKLGDDDRNRFMYEIENKKDGNLEKKSFNFLKMMDSIRNLDIRDYLLEYENCDLL